MAENYVDKKEGFDAVIESVAETLESFAFMEVLVAKEKFPYDESMERLRAEILIHDPVPGEIRLIIPKDLAFIIAENVYVMEKEQITEDILHDILSETANVIAGNIMSYFTSSNKTFKLGLPDIGQEAYLDVEMPQDAIQFDMEGHPFWLVLVGEIFTGSKTE